MSQPPNPPYGAPPPPGGYGGYGGPPPPAGGPYYVNLGTGEQGPYDVGQLAQMATAGQLKGDSFVRSADSQQPFPAKQVPGLFSDKEWLTTVLISWLLGVFGVDRFYLGYTGLGVAKLLTCGGCGIWGIIDLIMILLRKIPDAQGRPLA